MSILAKKNHLFRWSSFWSWREYKQAKLSHLGHRKPACIHWKANAPTTSHCLVQILVQSYNWAIFLREWARRGRYSQWRSLSGHVERIVVHRNWKEGYWQQLDVLCPGFEDRIISRVVWALLSWDLTPFGYYLWGTVKDKCYTDKADTIDALNDNIREAIDEMQLHTIDNVLKNWIDHVGFCMASRGSHLNEIIFHY